MQPGPCPVSLPHKADEAYLAADLADNADILITGNRKHFPEKEYVGVRILTPREFLDEIAASKSKK